MEFKAAVVIGREPLDPAVSYQYLVGAAYLMIGLFVYFRRGSAHKALHFYIFCLASFIFFCFHYTGKLNTFDKVIYFGNVAAGLLAPTVFLHFCLTFRSRAMVARRLGRVALLYVPAACSSCRLRWALPPASLQVGIPLVELRWMLDRVWMAASDRCPTWWAASC